MMTCVMKRVTGFERERVMGMGGLLDSQRLAFYISRELGAEPREITTLVMGEHGESMVPVFSNSLFRGRPVSEILTEKQRHSIAEKTRDSGAEVIKLKGATVFAPSVAIARMAEAILRDKRETIPLSAYLDGEYGIKGICTGVPAVLGNSGIEKIEEPELSEEEERAFTASAAKIKSMLSGLGPL
jgi:malate dehydrogenase